MKKYLLCVIVLGCLVGACAGCRKTLTAREMISIEKCDEFIQAPDTSPQTKKLAKMARRGVTKGIRTGPPVLIEASLPKLNGTGAEYAMFLLIWAPSGYVNGFTVIEKTTDTNGIVTVLEEDYPLLPPGIHDTGVYVLARTVSIRNTGQRKDEQVWEEYLRRSDPAEPLPDIWLSMPTLGKCEVEIVVHDRKGQVSNPMPLVPEYVGDKGQVIRGTPGPRNEGI